MTSHHKHPFVASRILAAAACALGAMVLLGWATAWQPLTQPASGWASMQPLSACCFVLGGAALFAYAERRLRAARLLALPLALPPAAALLQHWSGIDLGLDTLLFSEAVLAQTGTPLPGRMAEMTAFEFLLFCIFLAWPRDNPRRYRLASRFATLGLILAVMGGIGYVLGARALAQVLGYTTMSLYSAIGFALLYIGALLRQRDGNWLHLLSERSSGGVVARRLLAHVIGWPLLLALALSVLEVQLTNRRLEIALYAFCVGLALVIAVLRVARRIARSEAQRERAVDAMLHSRSQLAGVLETTLDAVITIDEARRIVFFNRAAERIFGCPAHEALGMPVERFLPERLREGESTDLLARRHDGSEFPIDASIAHTGDGGETRSTVILRDISQRKAFENRLRASEAQYRALFSNMAEGFALAEPVPAKRGEPATLRLLEMNDAFLRMTGVSSNRAARCAPLLEPAALAACLRVAQSGRAEYIETARGADDRHFELYAYRPMPERLALLMRDVTDQTRLERALQQRERTLQELIGSLPAMVWVASAAGEIQYLTRQWLEFTGTTLESQLGQRSWRPAHPDDHATIERRWQAALAEGSLFDAEYRLLRHDGEYHWVASRGVPLRDPDGSIVRWIGVVLDIDDLKRTQHALQDSEQRYRALFNNKTNAIAHYRILTDEQGRPIDYVIETVNGTYETMLGVKRAEVEGRRASEVFPGLREFEHDPVEKLGRIALEGGEAAFEAYFPPSRQWLRVYAYRPRPGEVTVIFTDITEQRLAEQRVRDAALHDALTRLPNRALLREYGNHLLAQAARHRSRMALLFIDLDRFKPINDLHGHAAGDHVLRETAKRLAACTRQEDLVGRLGGDEFVILLPHLDRARHRAATVARHVVEHLSRPFQYDAQELSISASVGISQYPQDGADLDALIHAADLAMYQAKQAGRAGFRFYTADLEREADETGLLETRLRRALREGGLALHYQPVIDLGSGRLIGAEALLRLDDGAGGAVGPARFIPVAEGAGLIGEIGDWVAGEACRQQQAWRGQGAPLTIAINLSPLQFRQRDVTDLLGRAIERAGIDPEFLQIEVTESAVIESVDDAAAIMKRIKSLGVKIALDDFGTGYSNLSRLSGLPLDTLKVGQSFVRGLEHDAASRAVTQAILALGRTLKLDVIGEGIESECALEYLRAHGCQQAQGFLFSEPLPAERFALWREEHALQ